MLRPISVRNAAIVQLKKVVVQVYDNPRLENCNLVFDIGTYNIFSLSLSTIEELSILLQLDRSSEDKKSSSSIYSVQCKSGGNSIGGARCARSRGPEDVGGTGCLRIKGGDIRLFFSVMEDTFNWKVSQLLVQMMSVSINLCFFIGDWEHRSDTLGFEGVKEEFVSVISSFLSPTC